jgi:hypothetical protein
MKKIRKSPIYQSIEYSLMMLICIMVALEVSYPPNPYTKKLIVIMSIYACMKHQVPERMIDVCDRVVKKLLKLWA